MRRFLYIPSLILLYLLTTAKSCDRQEQYGTSLDQSRVKNAQDSIKSTFGSDTLSGASLRAFEAAAKNRLTDFSDYLAIHDDTSVAETFREKAREMIRGLFISENSVLRLADPGNPGGRKVSVRQLLASGGGHSEKFGRIITDSVRVTQSLERIGDSMYTGTLSYSYSPAGKERAKARGQALSGGTVDFHLIKHQKHFGTDTLMIWEVFLGNME
jgi:hypothetical protein